MKSFPKQPTHPSTRRRPMRSKGFGGAESLIVASSRTRGAAIGVQLPGPPKPESAGPAPNRPRVAPESPQVGRCRKIPAGPCVGDGRKTAAQAATQGSSRRGRPARSRALNFRYRNIEAVTNDAIAMNFKPAVNIEIANPHLPSV